MKLHSLFVPVVWLTCAACGSHTRDGKARSDANTTPSVEATPTETTPTTNAMKALSARDYVASLRKGVDVDWSKTVAGRRSYSVASVQALKARGVDHVRIRVKDHATPELFAALDRQISDCLEHDVTPILAFQGGEAKENPTDEMRDEVVAWWRAVAGHYAKASSRLSFDLIIEVTDALSKDAAKLNDWYAHIYPVVRASNPTRVVFLSPRIRSNPLNLHELELPTEGREHLAAEWHFYASGPTKDPKNDVKRWTTGTAEERAMITTKIQAAQAWQRETGVPTWVGAWMANDYNEGDSYSIDEQIGFASFVACSLERANIPFAINQENKYYDAENGRWIEPDVTVFDVIFQPDHPRRAPCP